MNNPNSNHQEFIKQRQALIEISKIRGNTNTKFYFLALLVAVLFVAPVASYIFLTNRILDNVSSNTGSQVADTDKEVIITPLEAQLTPIEEVQSSTPSATPDLRTEE